MRSPFALLRTSRLALWLALVAVAAQFGLGVASAAHQARMLAPEHGWIEICTPTGFERIALDPRGAPLPGEPKSAGSPLSECLVCAAAAFGAAPTARLAFLPPAGLLADTLPAASEGFAVGPSRALRPPPRAPPVIS